MYCQKKIACYSCSSNSAALGLCVHMCMDTRVNMCCRILPVVLQLSVSGHDSIGHKFSDVQKYYPPSSNSVSVHDTADDNSSGVRVCVFHTLNMLGSSMALLLFALGYISAHQV